MAQEFAVNECESRCLAVSHATVAEGVTAEEVSVAVVGVEGEGRLPAATVTTVLGRDPAAVTAEETKTRLFLPMKMKQERMSTETTGQARWRNACFAHKRNPSSGSRHADTPGCAVSAATTGSTAGNANQRSSPGMPRSIQTQSQLKQLKGIALFALKQSTLGPSAPSTLVDTAMSVRFALKF